MRGKTMGWGILLHALRGDRRHWGQANARGSVLRNARPVAYNASTFSKYCSSFSLVHLLNK